MREATACTKCGAVEVPGIAAGNLILCKACTSQYLDTPSGSLVYGALVKGAVAWLHQVRLAEANAVPGAKVLHFEARQGLRLVTETPGFCETCIPLNHGQDPATHRRCSRGLKWFCSTHLAGHPCTPGGAA